MITLKPPFRAENMEGLYNKVIKGKNQKLFSKVNIPKYLKNTLQIFKKLSKLCYK